MIDLPINESVLDNYLAIASYVDSKMKRPNNRRVPSMYKILDIVPDRAIIGPVNTEEACTITVPETPIVISVSVLNWSDVSLVLIRLPAGINELLVPVIFKKFPL